MSHQGPPTIVLKKFQAMQAAAAAAGAAAQTNQPPQLTGPRVALLPSVYDDSSASTSPRAGPADQQPLISYDCGDIDMEEADSGPTTNYSHSHTAFSPDAKPFIPPSVNVSTRTPASIATNNMAPPTTAPPKRLPPHHKLQGRAPANPVPAASASTVSSPAVKTEPPASPSLSVRSHRPAPHTRLGPHAPKASATPQTQPSKHPAAPVTVRASPVGAQNALVNLHQSPESDQEPWVKIQEPPKVEIGTWVDLHGLDVKTEPETVRTEQSSSRVGSKSEAQISKVAASVENPPSPRIAASAINNTVSVQTTAVPEPDKTTDGFHRFSRNQWIPMLLRMNDTDEGRQLIRAFADHIRAGVDNKQPEHSDPRSEQGLFMEFADGQQLPATVPRNTTISEMTKEFAELVQVDESDVSVVLKVHVVEDHID